MSSSSKEVRQTDAMNFMALNLVSEFLDLLHMIYTLYNHAHTHQSEKMNLTDILIYMVYTVHGVYRVYGTYRVYKGYN